MGEPVRERLEKESAVLKSAIYGLIEKGQYEAAGGVMERYARIKPGDAEILQIEKMLGLASSGRGVSGEIGLLSRVKAVFVIDRLAAGGHGILNSVLRKVKLMEDNWGYMPLIFVCEHNLDSWRIEAILRQNGSVNRDTRFLNAYAYFQGTYSKELGTGMVYGKDESARYAEVSENVYEVYDGETLIRKEHFTGCDDRLRLAERFKDGRKEADVFYDDWGYLNLIREYGPDGRPARDNYYTTGRRLCVRSVYGGGITVYGEGGEAVRECADDAEFAAYALERITAGGGAHMLVSESGLYAKALHLVENENVMKAAVVHNVFLEDSLNLSSEPQPFYKYLCENRDGFDAIVFLTEAERADFTGKYGEAGNTFVIPHPYPYPVIRTDFEKRDHKKAVVITRFDPAKRVDLAIEIFGMAVKELPDAKLEIYGFGPLREAYEALIKRMGLEENVFLAGYTDDSAGVFGGAAAALNASAVDGFPLSLVESVCNGCPVFSFDIKYGPSDIIEDGKTGFLIAPLDKEEYASKLVSYLKDPGLQRTMSDNAYKSAERFGADRFLKNWLEMKRSCFYGPTGFLHPGV